jgi:hypothetical protein
MAKKETTKKTTEPKAASTAKPAGAKAKAAPKAKKTTKAAAAPTSAPTIDTNFAAQAAAKSLIAGLGSSSQPAPASETPRQESAGFKQLKAGLHKPALGGSSSSFLNNLGGGKKSNQPFGGGKQVGRNQTFGADVNRAGVPRRTGGG